MKKFYLLIIIIIGSLLSACTVTIEPLKFDCEAHPFASECQTEVDCNFTPDDPSCQVDCTVTPDDPACIEEEVNCILTPNDPACEVDCTVTPNDPECVVDCTVTPNDPECAVDCTVTPNDPECVVDCTITPNDPECAVDCTVTPNDPECVVDCTVTPNDPECAVDCTVTPDDPECEVDCDVTPNDPECIVVENYLEIYYINDFHGSIEEDDDEMGLAKIGNLIKDAKEKNPENVLFIAGGDILQGSALSNYFEGLSTINILNEIGMDAFAIGNHEFDWGIDVIQGYADGNAENGEANFPFLAANIFLKGTTDIPEGFDPYTIIQKGNIKVGIIGVIGQYLESSIATARVEDFEFVDPVPLIMEYTQYLRTIENVDIVLVVGHDSGNINGALVNLTGDYRVDAVFNGHSHSSYAYKTNNVPVIQSGSNGRYVGYVKIIPQNEMLPITEVENLRGYDNALLNIANADVQAVIDYYLLETASLFDNPILPSGSYYSATSLTNWIAQVINTATNSDISFHNYGGTRTSIGNGDMINLSVLYEVWPFDNVIKTVDLTGAEINALINDGGLGHYTDISVFEDDTLYRVATNDYVFDKTDNPFIYGENIVVTGLLLRDLAYDEFMLQSEIYSEFLTSNELIIDSATYESYLTETTP